MARLLRGIASIGIARLVAKRLKDGSRGEARPEIRNRAPQSNPDGSNEGRDNIAVQREGGPGPDSPLELEPRDWKATVKRTLKEIKEDRLTLVAAGMAYYFFLAIFPALIALVGILGLAHVDASGLVQSIQSSLPGGAGRALTAAVAQADKPAQAASLVAAISGVLLALFSATSGMVALQKGLDVAYDVEQDRKFVSARGVALVLLLATLLLGGVPSPIFTFGESIVFVVLGWVLTVAAIVILFSLYYYLAPNRGNPSWQWVSAGGIFGAVLWILVSVGFGFYVSNFSSYGKTYGQLAGAIVLILWLYLTSLAVLVGGELNAELERQSESRQQGG